MRRAVRGLVLWGVALGVVAGAGVPAAGAVGEGARGEADLAYHGSAVLADGWMRVRWLARNHGPEAVADTTVRLRWSVPLADRQELPQACARAGARVVVCRMGALAADAVGERMELAVRLRGAVSEALLELDTVWGGGAVDRNRENDRQRVLVLDTGDAYYF
ncbi:hypothetical protein [Streptomyces sp. enrichment culture]|uniref:hypothetical protein n=1 Tax=Streptomyces sp. enrichment culture TaxID=1795815 RepID=UPI003F56AD40